MMPGGCLGQQADHSVGSVIFWPLCCTSGASAEWCWPVLGGGGELKEK